MKKSMVALSLAVLSGAANAAQIDVFSDVTIDLEGEAEIQLYNSQVKSEDLEVNLQTFTITLIPSYEVSERLRISVPMGLTKNDGDIELDDFYALFEVDQAHQLSIGSQSTIFDDAGIGQDYMFGFTSFIENLDSSGDQVVKYKYDGGEVFYAGLAYQSYSNTSETNHSSSDYVVDGKLCARIEDWNVALFMAYSETNKLITDNYELDVTYTIGDLAFGGTYGFTNREQTSGTDNQVKRFGLTTALTNQGRWSYGAGWAIVDNDSNADKVNDFYINTTYFIIDNIYAYVELGLTDDDDQETGYVLGMDFTF